MTLLLGEWRKGKVRPIPGNAPHDRLVSRVISSSSKSICEDAFRTTRFPQLAKNTPGPRRAFLRDSGIFRSDVVNFKTKPWEGAVPPPVGRPPAQVQERAGRITPSSSFSMSSGRLFLDRVARQHCPSPLHRHTQINMHFSTRLYPLSGLTERRRSVEVTLHERSISWTHGSINVACHVKRGGNTCHILLMCPARSEMGKDRDHDSTGCFEEGCLDSLILGLRLLVKTSVWHNVLCLPCHPSWHPFCLLSVPCFRGASGPPFTSSCWAPFCPQENEP